MVGARAVWLKQQAPQHLGRLAPAAAGCSEAYRCQPRRHDTPVGRYLTTSSLQAALQPSRLTLFPSSQVSPSSVCTILSPHLGPSWQSLVQVPYAPVFMPSSQVSCPACTTASPHDGPG